MKRILFSLISLLIYVSCENEITKPEERKVEYYSVSGIVSYENMPVIEIEVILDSLKTITDSLGQFNFDSVKAGKHHLIIAHPRYISKDTIITINKDVQYHLSMYLKSSSYFPISLGNLWYYEEMIFNQIYGLKIEVVDSAIFDDTVFYEFQEKEYYNDSLLSTRSNYYTLIDDSLYEYSCDKKNLLAPFKILVDQEFVYQRCSIKYIGRLVDQTNDEKKYYYRCPGFDCSQGRTFEKGIGITSLIFIPSYNYELSYYEIK